MARMGVRIGIDTGGTFTDVVAVDEETGQIDDHQDAVDARRPGRGLPHRRRARSSACWTCDGDATSRRVSHGTTVATNQLLEGKLDAHRLHHHRGLRVRAGDRPAVGARRLRQQLLLGQAAADRPGATWCAPSAAGWTTTAPRSGPFDEERRPRGGPVLPRRRHHHDRRLLPARLRRTPPTSGRCATCSATSTPTPSSSISSEVLREYREYERVGDHARRRRGEAQGRRVRRQHPHARLDEIAPGVPFYVMKSNGGVLSADEVVHQPITTVLSGPAAGALGAALVAAHRRASTRSLTCDGGGTSHRRHGRHRRRARAHHRGLGRRATRARSR